MTMNGRRHIVRINNKEKHIIHNAYEIQRL